MHALCLLKISLNIADFLLANNAVVESSSNPTEDGLFFGTSDRFENTIKKKLIIKFKETTRTVILTHIVIREKNLSGDVL